MQPDFAGGLPAEVGYEINPAAVLQIAGAHVNSAVGRGLDGKPQRALRPQALESLVGVFQGLGVPLQLF